MCGGVNIEFGTTKMTFCGSLIYSLGSGPLNYPPGHLTI